MHCQAVCNPSQVQEELRMNLKDKTKKLCQSVLFFYEDKILVKNNFLKNLDVTIKKLKKVFFLLTSNEVQKIC